MEGMDAEVAVVCDWDWAAKVRRVKRPLSSELARTGMAEKMVFIWVLKSK